MIVKIDDAFSMIHNGANIKQGSDDSGYPITRIETIANRVVDRNRMGYAGIKTIAELQDYVLQDGDILMSHINSERHLGKVAIYEKQENEIVIHGMNLLCLRPKTEILNSRYAFYYLSSEMFLRQIPNITKKSVNQASFNITSLKELMIPIVSMELQLNIVDILDKLQTLIDKLNYQLIELDKLVKSRSIELFGDPISNPLGWPVKRLDDISVLITNGNTPKGGSDNYVSEGIIFLRSQNVWRNKIDLDDVAYIDAATHADMAKSSLHDKDILITKTGRINTENSSLGRVALFRGADNSANINGHVYLVRLDGTTVPEYVVAILTGEPYRRYIRKVCVGGIDKRQINLDQVEAFPIILPPMQLQQQFAAFVAQVDKSKLAVQQGLQELETLKKSLMQQYFG